MLISLIFTFLYIFTQSVSLKALMTLIITLLNVLFSIPRNKYSFFVLYSYNVGMHKFIIVFKINVLILILNFRQIALYFSLGHLSFIVKI